MNLPETACVSIQAPQSLLDLGGYHWGDDIIFDSTNGGIDADAGFKQATVLLKIILQETLFEKCGYKPREVLVFGFGQGGMAALNLAGRNCHVSSTISLFTDTSQSPFMTRLQISLQPNWRESSALALHCQVRLLRRSIQRAKRPSWSVLVLISRRSLHPPKKSSSTSLSSSRSSDIADLVIPCQITETRCCPSCNFSPEDLEAPRAYPKEAWKFHRKHVDFNVQMTAL